MIGARLRRAGPDDLDALRALFVEAVRTTGPDAYSPEQVETWARAAADAERFRRHLLGEWALVAPDADGAPLGFVSLDADRLSGLYVRAGDQRRGLGGALLSAALAEARRRGIQTLRAEASAFSLGLFQRWGFRVVGVERIERGGVAFERHLVTRELGR